jgi:hypothetical protein
VRQAKAQKKQAASYRFLHLQEERNWQTIFLQQHFMRMTGIPEGEDIEDYAIKKLGFKSDFLGNNPIFWEKSDFLVNNPIFWEKNPIFGKKIRFFGKNPIFWVITQFFGK